MEDDDKEQLKTLPLYFGKRRFLNMLHLVNLASFLFLVIAILLDVIPSIASLLLVFCAYRIYYLHMAKGERKDMNFICDVIVDGEYFLWPVVLFVGGNIIALL
jgi:4-hydroxybenzoate polyprenyltransferase